MAIGREGAGFGRSGTVLGTAGVPYLLGPDGAPLMGPDGALLLAPTESSTLQPAGVFANLASLGTTIPADFVGLSLEVSDFAVGGKFQGTTGAMGSFLGIASLLGSSGVIRLGGSSSNSATTLTFNQAAANGLASFVAALGSGWRVIYGLDLNAADSATAATQAGYLNNALGTKVSFQMGNEPFTSGAFTAGTYATAWNSYYAAITAAVPSAKFAACDDNSQGTSQTAIPTLTPGLAGLSAVTVHYYPFSSTNYVPSGTSIDWTYLRDSISNDAFFNTLVSFASGSSVPLIMSEINSVSQGGAPGVSDRMMSQAYYAWLAIRLQRLGWAGMYSHATYDGSNSGTYDPIHNNGDGTYSPRPVFYGMLAFSKIVGRATASLTRSGTPLFDCVAVQNSTGNSSFAIVNLERLISISVTPDQSSAWSVGNVLVSQSADGVGPTSSSMQIGGSVIGTSGAWSGSASSITRGSSVVIPPCGVAVINITG